MVLPPASLASIDAQSVSLNAWRVFVFALTPAIRYLKAFLEELVGLRIARASLKKVRAMTSSTGVGLNSLLAPCTTRVSGCDFAARITPFPFSARASMHCVSVAANCDGGVVRVNHSFRFLRREGGRRNRFLRLWPPVLLKPNNAKKPNAANRT